MRKNVLLKDGNDTILPITTIENVTGLNDVIDTVDTTYIYVGDCNITDIVQYLLLALEVPKKEITWGEYLENYKDLENGSLFYVNDISVETNVMGTATPLYYFNDNTGWNKVSSNSLINIQKGNNSQNIHYAINLGEL